MSNSNEIRNAFDNELLQMETDLQQALSERVKVNIDGKEHSEIEKEVISKINNKVWINDDGKIEHEAGIVFVRNPHLFPSLIKTAYEQLTDDTMNEEIKSIIDRKASAEFSHGVPALGHEDNIDQAWGLSFIEYTGTGKFEIQVFHALSSPNRELQIECAQNTGDENLSYGDKILIESLSK